MASHIEPPFPHEKTRPFASNVSKRVLAARSMAANADGLRSSASSAELASRRLDSMCCFMGATPLEDAIPLARQGVPLEHELARKDSGDGVKVVALHETPELRHYLNGGCTRHIELDNGVLAVVSMEAF